MRLDGNFLKVFQPQTKIKQKAFNNQATETTILSHIYGLGSMVVTSKSSKTLFFIMLTFIVTGYNKVYIINYYRNW